VDGDSWGLLWRQEHYIEGNLTDRTLHCTAWSTYEKEGMDAKYKTGRAFAFFTIIILILSVSPVFALSCATIDLTSLRLLAACFLLATLFQTLVFVTFASDVCHESYCKVSFGGGLTVAGMVFCVMTAYYLVRVEKVSHDIKPEPTVAGDHGNLEEEGKKETPEKQDDSSTHAIDDEDQHEVAEGNDAQMPEIREATEGEEEEAEAATSDTGGDEGDSEKDPAAGKRSWWWKS
jgi:hypothetical protein